MAWPSSAVLLVIGVVQMTTPDTGRPGPSPEGPSPTLRRFAEALQSDDVERSYRAGREAGGVGPAAIPVLIKSTSDARPYVREHALTGIQMLAVVAPETVPAVIPLLDDPVREVRRQACVTLAAFGPQAATATAPLVRLLRNPDEYVVSSAAYAIRHIGLAARAAAPDLLAVMRQYADEESLTCYEATLALDAVGSRDPGNVPVLTSLLNKDDLLAIVAADALGQYSPLPPAAVDALRRCVRKPDPQVRISAAVALWNTAAGDESIDVLASLASGGPDTDVRCMAIYAMAELRDPPQRAATTLRTLCNDREPQVRDAAADALGDVEATLKRAAAR